MYLIVTENLPRSMHPAAEKAVTAIAEDRGGKLHQQPRPDTMQTEITGRAN
jgi:hypothetical protein